MPFNIKIYTYINDANGNDKYISKDTTIKNVGHMVDTSTLIELSILSLMRDLNSKGIITFHAMFANFNDNEHVISLIMEYADKSLHDILSSNSLYMLKKENIIDYFLDIAS